MSSSPNLRTVARMNKLGIELKTLARFVLACQSPSISDTAALLQQTPSALSIAFHGLEERLGIKLFAQQGRYLGLLPSAFWLFRYASRLLYLESFARRSAGAEKEAPKERETDRLVVRLDLSFAIGRFSKALLNAQQEMLQCHPDTLVEWYFAAPADDYELLSSGSWLAQAGAGGTEVVDIFYAPDGALAAGSVHLCDDPWIATGTLGRSMEGTGTNTPLTALKMRPPLVQALKGHAKAGHVRGRLRFVDLEPAELGQVLADQPNACIVMPQSLLADRMGLPRVETTSLDIPLVSKVIGVVQRGHGRAAGARDRTNSRGQAFLEILRDNLAGEERNASFSPQMTMRQLHYFNLVSQSGGISAAARAAKVAQSSLSSQMKVLEAAVGTPLVDRGGEGTVLSIAGSRMLPFTAAIESLHDRILRTATDVAAHTQASVAIGTLPSSGHDSVLTERVAQAVTAIAARHPNWRLQISEGSNTVLHDKVRAGELNLAIVGMVKPRFARISLGPSEPLSVVAHPGIDLGEDAEISLETVCRLPLVLGTKFLSIHQTLVEAMGERNLQLVPAIEVGSLALAIAMVRRAPLCTVLPASSVRQDLKTGTLIARPIRHDELAGRLSVIFAADRTLSSAERTIVQELITVFRTPNEQIAPAETDELVIAGN